MGTVPVVVSSSLDRCVVRRSRPRRDGATLPSAHRTGRGSRRLYAPLPVIVVPSWDVLTQLSPAMLSGWREDIVRRFVDDLTQGEWRKQLTLQFWLDVINTPRSPTASMSAVAPLSTAASNSSATSAIL